MQTTIAKYITAFVIALVLASGHLLDGPSELDAIEAAKNPPVEEEGGEEGDAEEGGED